MNGGGYSKMRRAKSTNHSSNGSSRSMDMSTLGKPHREEGTEEEAVAPAPVLSRNLSSASQRFGRRNVDKSSSMTTVEAVLRRAFSTSSSSSSSFGNGYWRIHDSTGDHHGEVVIHEEEGEEEEELPTKKKKKKKIFRSWTRRLFKF